MRFLALQTDIELIKRQFLVEGEAEILTTCRHSLSFILRMMSATIFLSLFIAFVVTTIVFFEDTGASMFGGAILAAGILFYAFQALRLFIDWRYDFLIVTTEKVVVVNHTLFIYQYVNPIHLDNIASTNFESQYFGFGHCGIVHIALKERESGSSKMVTLRYIPRPDSVAGAIENVIALSKQRKQGEGGSLEQQQQKVEGVRERILEAAEPTEERPDVPSPGEGGTVAAGRQEEALSSSTR
jgi:hypothetical protein